MAPGLVEAFSDMQSAGGQAIDSEVSNITPVADGGSGTLVVREIWGGPAVGDTRKVLGAVSANAAGVLFRDTGGPHNTGGRFGPHATVDDVRGFNDILLGVLAAKRADTTRASTILDTVADMIGELPSGLHGHTYGNLVLTALRLDHGGDIMPAVREASTWLDARAKVIPVSADLHNLVMYDGAKNTIVYGEGEIDRYEVVDSSQIEVWLESGRVRNFIEDDPRKVRELLEAGRYAPRPQATLEAVAAVASSHIAIAGPGSPITSLRPALQPRGIAGGLATQRRRGGLWVAAANLDTEESTPDLTLEGYLGWLEEDAERAFSYVIDDVSASELSGDTATAQRPPEQRKIRGAQVIGAALVGAVAACNPHDAHRERRAPRLHNTRSVAYALRTHILPQVMPELAAV